MSTGYTILFHRTEAACHAWGLDCSIGVYHDYRPGRSSLACDLMEPYRITAVDRPMIATFRSARFRKEEFEQNPIDNSVRLTEDAWKRWLSILEQTMRETQAQNGSLQTDLLDRVRRFAETLPTWDGCWPSSDPDGTIDA